MKISHMVKGQEYIRIIPVKGKNSGTEDWSFTHDIMIFDGVSQNGNLRMHYKEENPLTREFGNYPMEIPYHKGWMPASIIWGGLKTELSNWEGMLIMQVKPILLKPAARHIITRNIRQNGKLKKHYALGDRSEDVYDRGYMFKPVKLLSATQYHLVIEVNGKQKILDGRYTDVNNWTLVE